MCPSHLFPQHLERGKSLVNVCGITERVIIMARFSSSLGPFSLSLGLSLDTVLQFPVVTSEQVLSIVSITAQGQVSGVCGLGLT